MNCSIKQTAFGIFSIVLLAGSLMGAPEPECKVWYPVYPVLKEKQYNPVARIMIHSPTGEKKLQEILVDVGKQGAAALQEVQVFYTGEDSVFNTTRLFAKEDSGEKVRLKKEITLRKGDNYFWVSVRLNQDTPLHSRLSVKISRVISEGKPYKLMGQTPGVLRTGIALRQHGEDGVDTYRIPGLITTNQGTLIAVYDVRYNNSADLQENIDVGINRSTDGGETWETMKIIMDRGAWGGLSEDANGIGDPCILVDRNTGTIWVAGLWTHGYPGKRAWTASGPGMSPKETGQFLLVKSEDDGLTWSEPVNITSQIKDPDWTLLLQGPGRGITMEDGTLVFPVQFKDKEGMPYATIISSRDHGETWHIGTGAKPNTTEAQVVQTENGSLMLNMRDNRGGARSVYVTSNLGETWEPHPTSGKALVEPVCMASIVSHQYREKNLLLFSNPSDTTERRHMTIKVSRDNGMSWPEACQVLLDQGRGRGYSCLTSIDQESVGILYEGSQADLVFQKISLEDLLGGDEKKHK